MVRTAPLSGPGLLLLLLCLLLPAMAGAASAPVLELRADRGEYPLGGHLMLLEDPSGRLDLDAVRSAPYSRQFAPSEKAVPTFGFTDSVYWIRFRLTNRTEHIHNWLLVNAYAPIEQLDLYIVPEAGPAVHQAGGSARPFNTRPVRYRAPVFEFSLLPNESATLYLRAQTQSSMILPLTLWEPSAFSSKAGEEMTAQGIYLGLIGAMIIYNLFIFFTVRERSYLYYVCFLTFFVFYQMSLQGLGQQYLWPENLGWSNRAIAVNGALAVLFGVLFTLNFLDLRRHHPRLRQVGLILIAADLVALGLSLFASYRMGILSVTPMGGLAVVFAIFASTASTVSGYRPARYFLTAWLMLVVGTALQVLRAYGVIPSNFITGASMQVGSAMEALLLSLALAARIRDMKRQQEKARQAVLENMQRMDRLKDEFLANTSHELRTPITGMTGLAEAMLQDRESRLTPADRENLEMIVSSGRRLNSLVNDILDFSRLRNRDLSLALRPVDLKPLVEVVLVLLAPLARDKQLALENEIPTDLPPVQADEARLQQILHNLIGNAIKFTANGSVRVGAEQRRGRVAVWVADTGIGIAPEDQEQIFESFNQGDGSVAREFGGTGLGLSITRKMVELHQGELTVESTPGQGSVFTFTLPVAERTTGAEETQEPASLFLSPAAETVTDPGETRSEPAAAESGHHPGHILVVDDEPVNRRLLRRQLEGVGYVISEAVDGQQALEQFGRDNDIGLVLLDVMMPRMSGFEVCRQLRKRYSNEQLPVIFLTAKNQNDDVIAALNVGANDYLSKPFSRDELLARVALHLNLARSYREMAQRNEELQALIRANESLEEISHTDSLTGLRNRRYLEHRFAEEVSRAQRSRKPLAVLVLDIDHFKSFNDRHGHLTGDLCLKAVARALSESVNRPYDICCRYGGEEFVVLLPDTDTEAAKVVAERIRCRVAATRVDEAGGVQPVTVSIGLVALVPGRGDTPKALLSRADEALYQAKDRGRNRVAVADAARGTA